VRDQTRPTRSRGPHRDPFDRLLIAQARIDGLVIVTSDRGFAGYGVPTLWAA
jgi:PIN domain nuclease of toxin-antitoxin system